MWVLLTATGFFYYSAGTHARARLVLRLPVQAVVPSGLAGVVPGQAEDAVLPAGQTAVMRLGGGPAGEARLALRRRVRIQVHPRAIRAPFARAVISVRLAVQVLFLAAPHRRATQGPPGPLTVTEKKCRSGIRPWGGGV